MIQKTIFSLIFICLSKNITSQITWIINKDSVITYYYQDGDEFDDTLINTTKWKYWYGWGRSIPHQHEQQYYTDGKNHELKNGYLNLFAKHEKINAKLIDWLPDSDSIIVDKKFNSFNKHEYDYTAGMIQSEKKFQYGYFEIKFKLPKEKGYWPAFWMYGGGPYEEIDWMELKTEDVNSIHVGRHSDKRHENRKRKFLQKRWWGGNVYFKGNLVKNYNVISGEWTPEYLKYYLNGECIALTKLNLSVEKFLCANIAVPSNNGPFKPGPDTSIFNSGNFEIDYIRVWTKDKSKSSPYPNNKFSKIIMQSDTIAKTKLRSKSNFLYGKRSEHKNEGIIVSLIPFQNNVYVIKTTGKKIPKHAFYLIKGKNKELKGYLKYGEQEISIDDFEDTKVELIIECFEKKTKIELTKN